jgi:argininosuccinate lyase
MDLQEVTPRLWESLQEISCSIGILSKFIWGLKVNKRVFDKPSLSFCTSTELANVLTRKYGVAFRTAHRIVGALTRYLVENDLNISKLTPELIQKVAKDMGVRVPDVEKEDIRESMDPLTFVRAHRVRGGPSPIEVRRMIKARKEAITVSKKWSIKKTSELAEANENLQIAGKSVKKD